MKKKQVLALMLAATMVTALPIQTFAADQSTSSSVTEEKIITGPSELQGYNYEGENFVGKVLEDRDNPENASISVDLKKGASNTTNFTFPSTVTVKGKNYNIKSVNFWPNICKSAKKMTFEEGIENISLRLILMNLDEITIPSTAIFGLVDPFSKDTLPTGEQCTYLGDSIKKVNFSGNDWTGYDKEHHAFYSKFHGDKLELRNLMVKAEGEVAKTDKYTADSIANLKAAIEDARAYLKDIYSDSELATGKMDALNSALNALVEKPVIPEKPEPPVTPEPPVEPEKPEIPLTPLEPAKPIINKSVLMGSIATAEKKMSLTDRYTAESIAQLKPIVDEAKALLHKEGVTQEEIDAMTNKVDQGINNLVEKVVIPMTPLEPAKPIEKPEPPVTPEPPIEPEKPEVNKSALEDAIKVAEEKVAMTDKYTEESIANLKAVLDEAKALVSDSNATQDMVDEMVRKLNSAMDGMVEKPEIPLTPLEPSTPVEKPEKPEPPVTPEPPVENPDTEKPEVVDKADLKDAIAKAEKEAALTTKYTKDSIAKLNAVVKDAKVLLEKADATQKDVDAMVEKVNKAVKDLVLVKPEQKPDDNKKPSTDDKKPASTDKKPEDKAPKTGDPASAGMLATLLAGSGAAIAAVFKKKK